MPDLLSARLRRFLLLLLVCAPAASGLLAVAGCGGAGRTVQIPVPAATPPVGTGRLVDQSGWTVYFPTRALAPKKWTVLVYMNAANNLEPYGTQNVSQLEQIGSTADVNVVVQWKRLGGRFDPAGGTWSDTRRYYITRAGQSAAVGSPLISENANVDMGQASRLQEFAQWGVAAFPAQRYCLVLWNHGAGWRAPTRRGGTVGAPTRGISYDDATGSHIDTIQIPAAIDIKNTGQLWDVVAMDASLMQMQEVAYEMRGEERYIVGSEESPPGAGYPYDAILADLTGSPSEDGLAFSKQIAQEMYTRYGANADTTQSVLDTAQVAAITPAVDRLGTALLAAEPAWASQIAAARGNTETFGHGDSTYAANNDLTDFLDQLTQTPSGGGAPFVNDPGVLAAVQGVRTALGNAILLNVHAGQHPNAHGLALFLPSPSQYRTVESEQNSGFGQPYTALAFSRDAPNWTNFLANGQQ